jgi:hypothetical protein
MWSNFIIWIFPSFSRIDFDIGLQDGRLSLQENLGEYLGYALFGSLSLLPYLDPEGKVMKTLSDTERWAFQFFFCVWWSAVSLGVPCKHSQDSQFLLQCAFAANRIGMIGITALVIWYSYHLIAPAALASSYIVMALACSLHVIIWFWVSFKLLFFYKL